MTLDTLATQNPEVEIFGEKWNIDMSVRKFGALKQICGIEEQEYFEGLSNNDFMMIVYAIWATTLEFKKPFNPQRPLEIERQLNLEKLFSLKAYELQEITDTVFNVVKNSLPVVETGENNTKKPQAPKKRNS